MSSAIPIESSGAHPGGLVVDDAGWSGPYRDAAQDRCSSSRAGPGLVSRESRIRQIAGSAARGEASALALADPWIFHHHDVNTADHSRRAADVAAERVHGR